MTNVLDLMHLGTPAKLAEKLVGAFMSKNENSTVASGVTHTVAGTLDVTGTLQVGSVTVSSTAAELNYLDIAALGTGAASKAVVLDSGDDYTWPAAGVLTYGVLADASTTLGATVAEINNQCDMSAKIVSIADATNTLALTQATHANRTLLVLDATLAVTLPEATGTGDVYKVVQGIAATASTFVTADTANAGFYGKISGVDTDAPTTLYEWAATPGTSDTITFNGVATGGKIYDWVQFEDVATDTWLLSGWISQSGGSEATPISSAA